MDVFLDELLVSSVRHSVVFVYSCCISIPSYVLHYAPDSFNTSRYYIHPPASLFAKPILLVPETQVQALLDEINSAFRIAIKLPRDPFLLAFYNDGTPAPILLGRSHSRDEIADMEHDIPPPSENHGECPADASPQLERTFARFKQKMERAAANQKKKKNTAVKKAKAKDRLTSHVNWCEALRRGQRYLGLRPMDRKGGLPAPDGSLPWDEQQKFEIEQKIKYGHVLQPLDVEGPAPHPFDRNVIFVSVDVEAFERAHNLITEIGVSTLDTADIKSLAPGEGGANWIECIRSRHFRISDHSHLRNTTFCTGNPEKFLFGRSEFVSMSEIGKVVDWCFEPPYSAGFEHDGKYKAQVNTSLKKLQVDEKLQDMTLEADKSGQGSVPSFGTSNNLIDTPMNVDQRLSDKVTVSNDLTPSELPETGNNEQPTEAQSAKANLSPQRRIKHRNIIIVGHDIATDLQYLSTLNSSIFHKPPVPTYPQPLEPESPLRQHILESLDTANLYQVWKREAKIASLAKVLVGVERMGWDLHNGGNDARYTLEALVGILVKARLEEGELDKPSMGLDNEKRYEGEVEKHRRQEEEKLAKTIRDKQEAVERQERENAAMWRHAAGPYGEPEGASEDDEVLPDPYQPQPHLAMRQSHPNLDTASAPGSHTGPHTSPRAQRQAQDDAVLYDWSSLPHPARDGGEPKGFTMSTPKCEKVKSSSRRGEEVLKLQAKGEIGGPCDWGVGGKDGW
jgi:hypothetical protein